MRRLLSLTSLLLSLAGCMSSGGGTDNEPDNTPAPTTGGETITESIAAGALAYEDWTATASGGTGVLPAGETEKGYVTCVKCHGWDLLGKDGGFARKARTAAEPNAGYGDTVTTASRRLHPYGGVTHTADDVRHAGGRGFDEGSAAWDGGSAAGIAKGNEHPDYTAPDGLSQTQVENLVAFLNADWSRADRIFSVIEPKTDPVLYRVVDTADAGRGQSYHQINCVTCHGAPDADSTSATNGRPGAGGFVAFLRIDGAHSKFAHRMHWGAPGTVMTRAAIGNPTAADVADVLAYIESVSPALVGDVSRGEQLWTSNNCTSCHGIQMPDRVTNYMGEIDAQMDLFVFSDQEVADLKAYLATVN